MAHEHQLTSTLVGLALILAIIFSIGAITKARGAEVFYDRNGSFAGSANRTGPNSKSFYDGAGRFDGSSIQHGNKTDFYDKAGRYQGSTTQQGTNSNPITGGRR